MTKGSVVRAAPVAWVRDMVESITYYVEQLGFECSHTDRAGGAPVYAVMVRDGAEVHLSAAHPDRAGTGQYHLLVGDVDALYEEFRGRSVEVLEAPADRPYGMRAFFFRDGDGNLIEAGVNHLPDR